MRISFTTRCRNYRPSRAIDIHDRLSLQEAKRSFTRSPVDNNRLLAPLDVYLLLAHPVSTRPKRC
ncbi:hypothetical protein TMatcc_000480 [Talaromyces marneffei ATCC 18224]